jgi:hypothetical protein
MTRTPRRPTISRDDGQTANEMLMIMGLLTAMLIAVTGIVLPTMEWVVEQLVEHMIFYVSSPKP